MRRYHLGKGWNDIAYHFIIEDVDNEYEIICGRMLNQQGAHAGVAEINKSSIGICLVGNFNEYLPPEDQWWKAVKLVDYIIERHSIPLNNIKGHRDFKATDCPGKFFDIDKFRGDVLNYNVD
jgi:N-acetyl-anhydromuramyl-L-alanine amidase AmpD